MINKFKHSLSDNRFLKNFISLLLGENISAVLQVISMTIIIKAIGNEKNGMLIMIQTYCYLMSDVMSMQTFNAVIKFVSDSIQVKNFNKAKQFIKLGFIIDFMTGFGAFILGIILFDFITNLMNWSNDFYKYVLIYLPVVFLRNTLTGTSIGILRFADEFRLIVKIKVIISLLRVIIYMGLWTTDQGFIYFLTTEVILELSMCITLIILSVKKLRKLGYGDFYQVKIERNTGFAFIRFNIFNGISLTMDLLLGHISNMFLSRIIGFSSLSIFRVLERIGSIASRITVPLLQLFYPEMVKLISLGQKEKAMGLFKKYAKYATPLCIILFGLMIFSFEKWMSIFTNDYIEYFGVTILYLTFSFFNTITSPIHALMIASGYVRQNAINTVIINSIYILILQIVIFKWGIEGFVILQLLQSVIMVIIKYLYIVTKYKRDEVYLKRG